MASINSRKGKRIARAACDMCRNRKVQCSFRIEGQLKCDRCGGAGIACTFDTERKPRGPTKRALEQWHNGAMKKLPTVHFTVQLEHLCSIEAFLEILSDFINLVYPVVPLIHVPTIKEQIARHEFATQQPLIRQCIAIVAVTVASLPRKLSCYTQNTSYSSVSSMVLRAIHLIQMSRVMEAPMYMSYPDTEHLTTSMMLCLAAHYATEINQGWAFANEVSLMCRSMCLAERRGYDGISAIETELRKRAFWCGYITQIHDRISAIAPHTGLSYLPRSADWDFILPLALHDEELIEQHEQCGFGDGRGLPPIVGFVSLIRVFRCCANLFSFGVPGSVNHAYSMTAGPIDGMLLPSSPESSASASTAHAPSRGLAAIVGIFHTLGNIMNSLPPELQFDRPGEDYRSPADDAQTDPFKIMAANIHITSLYLQSSILETFAGSTRTIALTSADTSDEAIRVRNQIWTLRESIAQELLQLLEHCPSWAVEANGASMIGKIREIASTLLNDEEDEGMRLAEQEATSRGFIQKFVELLSNLDFGARRGEAATNWSGT